jgi:hypothetical protein
MDNDQQYVSFAGIDPAELVHALYLATRPLGMGHLHDKPNLTVDEVRAVISKCEDNGLVYFDYLFGRPLKLTLELKEERFRHRLYDRDAGAGCAQEVVDDLRRKKAG